MSGTAEHLAARAARILQRPGAWLQAAGGGYAVREDADLRRRPRLRLDEAAFMRLVDTPGLRPRPGGGWLARPLPPERAAPQAGRPGVIEGERCVPDERGKLRTHRANLGESPIAWLARRKDAGGTPWLTAAQAAAGEKLREDFYLAGTLGRLTMAWDAAPKSRSGSGVRIEPVERARAAKARAAAALTAVGPEFREIVERVCIAGSALDAAEQSLGLPRRSGKLMLRMGLQRLAVHYGVA